ncbi:MAG: glycosyltransferase family A protein [Thermoplasmata archaeon]
MADSRTPPPREDAPAAVDPRWQVPQISVVIGAVERDRFVHSAVESVLAQTLPRHQYEILVTRDFASSPVEGYLRANGVQSLWDPDRSQGRVVRAARAARAPLIAYLDDDDLFEPERLAEALAVFRAHPEVSFYRNRVSVVNEAGDPTDPGEWDRLYLGSSLDRTGALLIEAGSKRARWTEALESYPEFNLSSMILRREMVDGGAGTRLQQMAARIDLGHFVEAYLAPGAIYLDDRRLTRYRLHRTNSSRIRVRPGQRVPRGWEDLGRLERRAVEQREARVARWIRQKRIQAGLGFHVDRLTRAVHDGAPTSAVSPYTREYLRFALRNPSALVNPWSWRPFAYSIVQVAVPTLTRTRRADVALRRDILANYPQGSWSELKSTVRGH